MSCYRDPKRGCLWQLSPRSKLPTNRAGPGPDAHQADSTRPSVSERVLKAYDKRCAFTGFQFINGGGRAEVEAAHIKSVGAKGPDVVQNGLALSGTVHWMFDRGLLTLADDERILLSNHINDVDGVLKILNQSGKAHFPEHLNDRPDPQFLRWHREIRFNGSVLN